jgi:pimeloyl-[acyl-carrier protein] synthase
MLAYDTLSARDRDLVVASDDYQRFCAGSLHDPYPLLSWLQDHDPVHWCEPLEAWILTRYADVRACLLDKRMSNDRVEQVFSVLPADVRQAAAPLIEHVSNWLGFTNGEKHARLRGLLRETLTPAHAESLAPRIRELCDALLDELLGHAELDLVSGYALPLPALVICDILGLDPNDRQAFQEWSEDMVTVTGTIGPSLREIVPAARGSYDSLDSFIGAELAKRQGCPGDDLIGKLSVAEHDGRIDRSELVGSSVFTLVAGHETTSSLLGNALLTLLSRAELVAALEERPDRWESFVEEMLRLESPIRVAVRVPLEDVEIGATAIGSGSNLLLHLAAANRDPRQWPDADQIDLDRGSTRHVAFAWGPHFCLGAPLARLEARIALPRLLERAPDLKLVDSTPRWRDNLSIRGLTELPARRTLTAA